MIGRIFIHFQTHKLLVAKTNTNKLKKDILFYLSFFFCLLLLPSQIDLSVSVYCFLFRAYTQSIFITASAVITDNRVYSPHFSHNCINQFRHTIIDYPIAHIGSRFLPISRHLSPKILQDD